jgi:acyl-CoA thioesterase
VVFDQLCVDRDGEAAGRYRAILSGDWNAPILPQGGVVVGLALRAMQAELGSPVPPLRSVSAVFAAQVPAGPLAIDARVLRRGRSASQVLATVRAEGAEAGHTALAVFGEQRPGFEFTELRPPEVPPPEACPSFDDAPADSEWERRFDATFWDQVEGRFARGHTWWDRDWTPTGAERIYWYRFRETPRLADGRLDPLALLVLCDTMPGAVGERVGPLDLVWLSPSADLTVQLLGDATSEWLLAVNRARHAGSGYASLEMELWDPARGLVAHATQLMFFSFPDGPPSTERLKLTGADSR